MKTEAVARHVLARAAAKVGGVAKLAARLNLSQRALSWYVHGDLTVPRLGRLVSKPRNLPRSPNAIDKGKRP